MATRKERLTVTVDSYILEMGNRLVASGRADSLSGWVNRTLAEQIEKERRLAAMAEAVAAYEKEFGEIGAVELSAQERADRRAATVVRGSRRKASGRRRRRAA